ncbi:hypothetical protein [Nocardioides ultimimeridianus]
MRTRLLPAALAVALLPLSALVCGTSTPAVASSSAITVATMPSGHQWGGVVVTTTPSGASVLAYSDSFTDSAGHAVSTIRLRRQSGTSGWTSVFLPPITSTDAYLDEIGAPGLMYDGSQGRLYLEANASSSGSDPAYGHYIWYSDDDGAGWNGPVLVHTNAWSNDDASPDGQGGFYMTVDDHESYQAHVPSSYPTLGWAETYSLTDRLISRGNNNLTTAGSAYVPLYFFEPGTDAWVHPGTQDDANQDRKVFTCPYFMSAAGDTSGALAMATYDCDTYTERLQLRAVTPTGPTTVSMGPVRTIAVGHLSRRPHVHAVPGSAGHFVLQWNDDDKVWAARVSGGPGGTIDKYAVFDYSAHGLWYYTMNSTDISRKWLVGIGQVTGGKTVLWATRNSAMMPQVGVAGATYDKSAGKAAYTLRTNSEGTAVVTLVASWSGHTASQKVSYAVGSAGSWKRSITAGSAIRGLLGHAGAKAKLVVTFRNSAGTGGATSAVRIVS